MKNENLKKIQILRKNVAFNMHISRKLVFVSCTDRNKKLDGTQYNEGYISEKCG